MKARVTLKPHQRGAKKLHRQYGDQLLYVRYRYDSVRKKRFTTVELIVDEADWMPRSRPASDQIVGVRVDVTERDLQKRIKQAGGTWNRRKKVWYVQYDTVVEFGLQARMVSETEDE
jgi:hypothetical protein